MAAISRLMYLKSIRVQGFKTFARRTELPFSRGITAIVGPNGSGKSNLVDAIRWALGERNARGLRGQRMEDVIYSGGPGKSGMGMAEVTLVLDNAEQRLNVEFTELEVARRLYRSGESEYLVNGARARLRDIDALLSSTGLRQDGYAVTAQNDIDFVIQAAPPVRRELIEEAAGVRRLRAERQEALTRLTEAERDMRRARDLLNELSPRAEELREQAVAATEYQRVADQLRTLQGSLARDAWRKAMVGLRRATGREHAAASKRDAAAQVLATFTPLYEEHRAALIEAQQARWTHQQAVANARLELAEAEHQVRIASERAEAVAHAVQVAVEERDRLAESARAGTQVVDELERELIRLNAQAASLEQAAATGLQHEQAAGAELSALQARRAELAEQRQELHRQELAADAEIRQIEGRLQFLDDQRQQVVADLEAAQERSATLHRERDVQQRQTEQSRREMEGLAAQVRDHDLAVASGNSALAAAEEELATSGAARQAGEAELAALRAVRDRLAQQSPLHEAQTSLRPVVECIRVDDGDRLAVEAALEGSLKGWFAADPEAAGRAAALLRSSSHGRETVLFDPGSVGDASLPDGLIPVTSLIDAPPDLARALSVLLNQVVVAADSDEGRQIVERLPTLAVVTRAGEMIRAGSYRAGGEEQAPLQQQAHLQALTEQLARARDQEERSQERVEGLVAAQAAARARQAAAVAEFEAARLRHAQLMSSLSAAGVACEHAQAEWDRLTGQLARLDALLATARTAQTEVHAQRERADAEAQRTNEEVPQLQQELSRIDEQLAALIRRRQELELQAALGRQRRDDLVRQVERARAVCRDSGDALAQRSAALAELEMQPAALEAEIAAANTSVAARRRALAELEATPPPDSDAVAALEAVLREDEQRNVGLQVELAHAEDGLAAAHLEVENATAEVQRCADALREDGQGLDETDDDAIAEVDWQKTEREVNRLQRRLEAMGPVNLLAPQEFTQLSERCQTIQTQLADLETASAQLTDLRHRLEREIDDRFRTVFQAVTANFQEFFAELFEGGGRATLRLSGETDDPLDEGVEILAQTPGKRMQALTLLSGGERALTALAFLFALQAVNPSPFYVLDEVDAALDDANVLRFNRVLARLAQNQQFLVVTHNHSTMAQAEVLYGVTLGEHGISRVVSVRLQEAAGSVRLRERTA